MQKQITEQELAQQAHEEIMSIKNPAKVPSQCTGNPILYSLAKPMALDAHVRCYGRFVASYMIREDGSCGWLIRFKGEWVTPLQKTVEYLDSLPFFEESETPLVF